MRDSTQSIYRITTAALFCLIGLSSVDPLFAQTMLSDFKGVVTDSSGAGVPGVSMTVTNEATNAKRTATTDDSGNYRVDGILVGTYSLEAEVAGFKRFVQTGID